MKIITHGEHTIDRIITEYYGEEVDRGSMREQIAQANPHIVSLSSLTVGDVLELPGIEDDAGQELPEEEEEEQPTTQLPAIRSIRKR